MGQAGNDWDKVARAWAKWWPDIERNATVVVDRMLELAAIEGGEQVLDVATGVGEPAVSAARRVGPEGRVLATDVSATMIALARERAQGLALDNIEFREMDADRLDLPESSFDLVLSRWGLMFVADLDQVLRRLAAVLKPGGRLVAAVWDQAPKVPMISFPAAIFQDTLSLPPPAGDRPTPFDLADQEDLTRRLRAAGFEDVRSVPVEMPARFDSGDHFLRFRREVAHPDPRLEPFSAEQIEAVWDRVAAALRARERADGSLVLDNVSHCIVGARP